VRRRPQGKKKESKKYTAHFIFQENKVIKKNLIFDK
jgi:hypothetical protein